MKTRYSLDYDGLSLLATLLTVAFAVVVHFAESGSAVILVGFILSALFTALWLAIRKTGSGMAAAAYGILSLVPVLGFGIVNGFWNHLVKLLLVSLHGGALPPLMAGLFLSPNLGSPLVEILGVLMFPTAIVAGIASARFLNEARRDRRAAPE
jgi:hypothetical protein